MQIHSFAAALALVFGLTAHSAEAAYEFYVTVKGVKQGDFKSNDPTGRIPGISFHYNVKSPRDIGSGQATGKRTHHPVTFVKEWGPSTPQFFQALTTNEVLSQVEFHFVRTNDKGLREVYFTVRLINASVSEMDQRAQPIESPKLAKGLPDVRTQGAVSLTFQRIEFISHDGKTMAVDDWGVAP